LQSTGWCDLPFLGDCDLVGELLSGKQHAEARRNGVGQFEIRLTSTHEEEASINW
jgi:hypothetical protein